MFREREVGVVCGHRGCHSLHGQKENVEVLKEALTRRFGAANCIVKSIQCPSAQDKHSCNGCTIIEIRNEESLKKCQSLGSKNVLVDNKTKTIRIQDSWPENPESIVRDRAREINAQHGAPNSVLNPGSGEQHKCKKRLRMGGPQGPAGPRGPPGPRGPGLHGAYGPHGPFGCQASSRMCLMGPRDKMEPPNRWDSPSDFYGDGPEFGPYDPEYQDYLEYEDYLDDLKFRDYVAMRKAFGERREFAEFLARYHAEQEDEFMQQPQQSRQPPLHPPLPSTYLGHVGSGGYSRLPSGFNEIDDGFKGSPYRDRDRSVYNFIPSRSANHSRDYCEFDCLQRGAGDGGFFNSGSGPGGYGGGGGGNRSDYM